MIIYSSKYDGSTNDVLDWIFYLSPNAKVKRYNDYEISNHCSIHIGETAKKSERSWYRRGDITHNLHYNRIATTGFAEMNKSYGIENKFVIQSILHNLFDQDSTLNAPEHNNTNKIINLKNAFNSGLKIPETFVSNSVAEINQFLDDGKHYIIKDIALDPFIIDGDGHKVAVGLNPKKLTGYSIKSKINHLNDMHARGFLFIQEYIEKKIELRIFYLQGKFYSMAIFSQSNERTRIDYRNYDYDMPNRCVPFSLPGEEERKIHQFMKMTGINCGSIDMIYSPDGHYVFLEVNPIGQFQWLSKSCNFPIEKEIAEYLLNK